MKASFGIRAEDLKLRESAEVAEMGARATTQGNVVRFAPGEFRPDTKEWLEVPGHELSHVREQAMGDVHANVYGSNLHYDERNEAASDRAGEVFASGGLSAESTVSLSSTNASAAPVQGLFGGLRIRFKNWLSDVRWKRAMRKMYGKGMGEDLPENPIMYSNDDWTAEKFEEMFPFKGPQTQQVYLKSIDER